jgi:hypothetical protein
MASHWSFGHLQPKLWAKEGPGVKLAVWLPTTKSRESTSSRRLQMECDGAWKTLEESYNFGSDLTPIRGRERGVVGVQSPGSPTRDNFGTLTWESREKEPFRCSLRGVTQRILYGGRWWFPPSPGCGESCVSKCPWLVPTPKGVLECELSLSWLVLDADSSLII